MTLSLEPPSSHKSTFLLALSRKLAKNLKNYKKMALLPENNVSLEWSLPVPSVLAVQELETMPSRYIRDDMEDLNAAIPSDDDSFRVPLIDFSKLVNSESQDLELQKLHSACKEWGVFQLKNHGISEKTLMNIKKEVKDFFDLPIEEKKRWAMKPGCVEGYGQPFVSSEKQKLDWNDMVFLRVLPIFKKKLEFWPQNPPKFRESLENYIENIRDVTVSLSRLVAKGLGLEHDKEYQDFCSGYQEGTYEVRINHYPPCPLSEQVIGLTPHGDVSGLTLLLDCGDVPGLQVLKDGQWIPVSPIDGAIIVNIGHVTELMSNGIYKAPIHRAVVNKEKERISIVCLTYPSSAVKIGPTKQAIIKSGSPALYKTLTFDEYLHTFFNRKFEDSFIDLLKI